MEVEAAEFGRAEEREQSHRVICQLTDAEGTPLGSPIFLPETAGPKELQHLVNQLLNNEEKLPYTFYVSDHELAVELGSYLQKNKGNLLIPFRGEGHTEAVLSVAFSPDGHHLASGSGDTTVRMWDLNTQTPLFTCKGHKNWVLCIAWSPDGKHLVSGSKAGELICWDPQTGKSLGNPLMMLNRKISY
ncbi:hypothetical protein SASPL_135271 [Salvia splendens]|uniref:NLE domain-containing protein n=1 Tax=Salvia splendens TaxID=180675 RepID=A0A8X8WYG9_SALSN|nr:hypothetical protein SASPL_135271 [Salvia splendens]